MQEKTLPRPDTRPTTFEAKIQQRIGRTEIVEGATVHVREVGYEGRAVTISCHHAADCGTVRQTDHWCDPAWLGRVREAPDDDPNAERLFFKNLGTYTVAALVDGTATLSAVDDQ